MHIADAQREVRTTYVGGFFGQLVSGAIWLVSAACTTWLSPRAGVIALVIGGMFIFPLTQLILRMQGQTASLSANNPFRELAVEVAFLIPLLLPLVAAAALHRIAWFYPAMMIVVGAHYLPFAFLYGMRAFIALAGVLVSAGSLVALLAPQAGLTAGWLTGLTLLVFAFVGRTAASHARSHAP